MLLMPFNPTDAVAFGGTHFGQGRGTVYLDEVSCIGQENKLTDCSRSSLVHCSHDHREDAGVRCQGLETLHTIMYLCCSLSGNFPKHRSVTKCVAILFMRDNNSL